MNSLTSLAAVAALSMATYATVGSAKWTADLKGKDGSSISGSATVESTGRDTTRIGIGIKGGMANANLTWHMHTGSCGGNGSIVGAESAYPPLTVRTDGTAEATVVLPIPTPASGTFSVNVHTPGADSKVVACGDLKPSGM